MRSVLLVLPLLLAPGVRAVRADDKPSLADRQFFEKKVRPVLLARCFECHSTTAGKQRGGLRLDSRPAIVKGGDSGPVIDSTRPEKSLLLKAIRHDVDVKAMPPKGKLPANELLVLEEWVKRGGWFPGDEEPPPQTRIDLVAGRRFWSFQPLKAQSLPSVRDSHWASRRLDTFLLAAMEKRGLLPAPQADRRTLLRRVTFDLIGLPPTPDQLDAFLADTRPDAYEQLVDRLLASPAHGERWGRFWLDLVRYADITEPWADLKGTPHLYRDWVVQAFNDDLGYDRLIERQLAADLAPDATQADRAALGFLGLSPTYWKELKLDHQFIKGVVAEEWEERIHTLTSAVLGLTVACARCHDHKYDPVTTHDYYALAGVFASIRQADLVVEKGQLVPGIVEGHVKVVPDGLHRTRLIPTNESVNIAIQIRGNPANPGAIVPRGFLGVLSAAEPRRFAKGSGRLELARALVGDAGALTARVMVNRVWKHHFAEGLVRTPSDFGSQGDRPSHPELLDDLAARFIDSGWSLKWLHREIVLSSAYRQASRSSDGKDPDNRWLARMNRRRLEVEAWRDAMLFVTGKLRRQMGGLSASLDQPENDRRTIYGQVKRRELSDILRLYDFPDPTTHSSGRMPTTTPLQQLYTLNSPWMQAQAQALVRRLHQEAKGDQAQILLAYRLLFGRTPTPTEMRLGQAFVAETGWAPYAQSLLASNEFLYVD